MVTPIEPAKLVDSTVVDREGSKIGKVGSVYLSDETGSPEWVTVKTGLFGHKENFVPLQGASMDSEGLHVSVDKQRVTDAPRIDPDGHLSQQENSELYKYYNLPVPQQRMASGGRSPQRDNQAMAAGAAPNAMRSNREPSEQGMRNARDMQGSQSTQGSQAMQANREHALRDREQTGTRAGAMEGAEAKSAKDTQGERGARDKRRAGDDTMIRSEEQLKVGTEQVETGHVRLRKYVVTEEQQITVPVSHEEVRLEREPITGAERETSATIGEETYDVTLHAEKPVVRKETVAVERVRLGTEKITEEQTVTDSVRKERVEVEDDTKKPKHGRSES
ncbi:hypothetical protein BAY61_30145 [Prauserella marina]|uniref:Conserved domain-containing protein n=2 Tax=Prauserella marina TaxID=530584 RepID=A0A222VXB3_9PSEU|nr:PRC and DUF2382 domain-containing protein [Prauserella marina]ASR38554.1 hypothetical protein BAY61_30145 [Prauserella marina]PWV81864.1 uncharacterized protein (TIGR02271 family) [Prauserella marina]SDD14101.1 conserved domain-containing protein [Prauserella marina]